MEECLTGKDCRKPNEGYSMPLERDGVDESSAKPDTFSLNTVAEIISSAVVGSYAMHCRGDTCIRWTYRHHYASVLMVRLFEAHRHAEPSSR